MPTSQEPNKDLFDLFDRALVGLASEEDALQLEACLIEFAEYRKTYRNIAALHLDLAGAARRSHARQAIYDEIRDRATGHSHSPKFANLEHALKPPSRSESTNQRPIRRNFNRPRILGWLMVAATTSIVFFVGDSLRRSEPTPLQQRAEKSIVNSARDAGEGEADIIAFLTRVDDVVWKEGATSYSVGAALSGGDEIYTESGEVEIEFVGGARLSLSSKSRFTLENELLTHLYSGRLSANVPPRATGFTVETPQFRAIDRGTAFTLAVGGDGSAGAVVLSGAVDIDRRHINTGHEQTKFVRLRTGQGLWADNNRITTDKQDGRLVTLTEQAPTVSQPGGKLIANYREDFALGTQDQPNTAGRWNYFYNRTSPFGDPSGYAELLWDGQLRYDCDGAGQFPGNYPHHWLNLRPEGGHPGCGVKQPDVVHDLFAIAAFKAPRDGRYRLESAWIKSRDLQLWQKDLPRSLEVAAHVGDHKVSNRTVMGSSGFANFSCDLGRVNAGEMIYVGVGPDGDGGRDTFDWNFTIVAESEGTVP